MPSQQSHYPVVLYFLFCHLFFPFGCLVSPLLPLSSNLFLFFSVFAKSLPLLLALFLSLGSSTSSFTSFFFLFSFVFYSFRVLHRSSSSLSLLFFPFQFFLLLFFPLFFLSLSMSSVPLLFLSFPCLHQFSFLPPPRLKFFYSCSSPFPCPLFLPSHDYPSLAFISPISSSPPHHLLPSTMPFSLPKNNFCFPSPHVLCPFFLFPSSAPTLSIQ